MNSKTHSPTPAWKRALDLTAIVLASPFLLPLMLGIAALIRLASPGPILFRQERVGFRGRPFTCLKFRSMRFGAETASHEGHLKRLMENDVPMVKLDDRGDARVFPLGRLLRASALDEFPQLINVLKGEMSLVGPRPCLPYEAANLQPWQKERFDTVPGLTGLWQVSGKNQTTFTRMIQLDIDYIHRQSLARDLIILAKTVPVLIEQMARSFHKKRSTELRASAPGVLTARSPHVQ